MELEQNGTLPILDVLVKKKYRWHPGSHGVQENKHKLISTCGIRAPSGTNNSSPFHSRLLRTNYHDKDNLQDEIHHLQQTLKNGYVGMTFIMIYAPGASHLQPLKSLWELLASV
jgi:hypothetical protein